MNIPAPARDASCVVRHSLVDASLRFYLAAGRAAQDLARRGRPEAAFRVIERR